MIKPFGELTRVEQLALFEAWLDGKVIEAVCRDKFIENDPIQWVVLGMPSWGSEGIYRVALTKPSINWDHVHPMYKYLATDKNGSTYLYTNEVVPWISGEVFHTDNGNDCDATCFASFKAGTCDWKDSLVKRPK